jgi:hypothetical protein
MAKIIVRTSVQACSIARLNISNVSLSSSGAGEELGEGMILESER